MRTGREDIITDESVFKILSMFYVTSCQLNLKSYRKWVTYYKSKLSKLTENAEKVNNSRRN